MIELNKVGIEIDGKVYQCYKINFGFQRRLIELQSSVNKLTNAISKKYGIEISEIGTSDKPTNEEKLAISEGNIKIQDALACLFVNKDEAKILDSFDMQNATELITALQ